MRLNLAISASDVALFAYFTFWRYFRSVTLPNAVLLPCSSGRLELVGQRVDEAGRAHVDARVDDVSIQQIPERHIVGAPGLPAEAGRELKLPESAGHTGAPGQEIDFAEDRVGGCDRRTIRRNAAVHAKLAPPEQRRVSTGGDIHDAVGRRGEGGNALPRDRRRRICAAGVNQER